MNQIIAQAAETINATKSWAEHGLAGLVIFALFCVLVVLVKWLVNHIDKQQAEFRSERDMRCEAHSSEREEWRQQSKESTDKFEMAVRDLNESIRSLGIAGK